MAQFLNSGTSACLCEYRVQIWKMIEMFQCKASQNCSLTKILFPILTKFMKFSYNWEKWEILTKFWCVQLDSNTEDVIYLRLENAQGKFLFRIEFARWVYSFLPNMMSFQGCHMKLNCFNTFNRLSLELKSTPDWDVALFCVPLQLSQLIRYASLLEMISRKNERVAQTFQVSKFISLFIESFQFREPFLMPASFSCVSFCFS